MHNPPTFAQKFTWVFLGILLVSSFFIRMENFKYSKYRTIDEIVYQSMGMQLRYDITRYNAIPYGKELASEGRPLPKYFFQPLFKHPPVFSMLIALSLFIFGPSLFAIGFTSVFLGSLTILLTYFIGKEIFGRGVGLLAAFLLWMDPVSIICSQKAWMDTTIAFWTVLSVMFFVFAVKRNKEIFFIWSGIALGMGMNTKYTAVLALVGYLLYAFFYHKELFRRPAFYGVIGLPFVLLLPWISWNVAVYGGDVFTKQITMHTDIRRMFNLFLEKSVILIPLAVVFGVLYRLASKFKSDSASVKAAGVDQTKFVRLLSFGFLLFLFLMLWENILLGLNPGHFPRSSWRMGFFAGEPPTFYFGQLLEFSMVYIFAYIALFRYYPEEYPEESKGRAVLRLVSLGIFLFFVIYRNYQSRYIVAVLPFFLILASDAIVDIFRRISVVRSERTRRWLMVLFSITLCYMVTRTNYLNFYYSFANELCYF